VIQCKKLGIRLFTDVWNRSLNWNGVFYLILDRVGSYSTSLLVIIVKNEHTGMDVEGQVLRE